MEDSSRGEFTTFEHRTTGVLYLTAGCLGVYVNLLTLLIFCRQKPLGGARNMLHINLALANIMIVICTPFSGLSAFNGKWLFGELGCRLYGLESYTGGIGAVTFASFLCLERFFTIVWKSSCKLKCAVTPENRSWGFRPDNTLLVLLGWLISLAVSVGPFLGWNSYVIEESGTACGLDWRDDDRSFFKFLLWINSFLAVIAALALWSTFTHDKDAVEVGEGENEWFTEKQLNWIAVANFAIVTIGFSPYGYFALWAVFSERQSMTMLASVIPPLAAKLSTVFYPVVYLVASKRFRMVFASKAIGYSGDKKTQ